MEQTRIYIYILLYTYIYKYLLSLSSSCYYYCSLYVCMCFVNRVKKSIECCEWHDVTIYNKEWNNDMTEGEKNRESCRAHLIQILVHKTIHDTFSTAHYV